MNGLYIYDAYNLSKFIAHHAFRINNLPPAK